MNKETARDRFRSTALLGHGRVPRFEAMGFWEETIANWHQQGLPAGMSPWEYFHLDQFMDNAPPEIAYHTDRVITPPYWPPFATEVLEETEEHIIHRQSDGIVVRQLKGTTSIPQFLQFPVQSEQDWEPIRRRLDPQVRERYQDAAAAGHRLKGRSHVLRFGFCGAYGFLRNLFGPENLCYALYDAPEFIRRLLKHWVYYSSGIADHLCPLIDFDYVFIWEDMAFKTGPLMSPQHFRSLILPCYQELLGYLRDRHGFDLFMLDSDGSNWELLPLFLEGGINIFTPLEIAAGMEPLEIRRRYPQLALLGGLDKRALLHGQEAIREEIERKVPVMLEQGGYFPGLDHHVPADIRFEAFCYYLERLREIEER